MNRILFNTWKSALGERGNVFDPLHQPVARILLKGSEIDPQLNNAGGIYFRYSGGIPDESNFFGINNAGGINFQWPGFRPGYKRHHKLSTPEELPSNCTILTCGVYVIGNQPTPGLGVRW